MSLKDLKAALEYFEDNHCSTDCQSSEAAAHASEMVSRAWACVEVLEDAASEIAAWAAGESNNGAGPTKAVALMESIAKEYNREDAKARAGALTELLQRKKRGGK